MRLFVLASAATFIGGAALAQTLLGQSQPGQNVIAVPLAPPVIAAPPSASPAPVAAQPPEPPPGLVQTPLPSPTSANVGNADNGASTDATQAQAVSPDAGASAPAQPTAPDIAPTPANNWVPGKTAELGVLNKVEGSTKTLTIPVGGQASAGDLTVSVQACVTRPPGTLPDSAVFVTLQSNAPEGGGQVYRGWMVHSAPGATDVGDADDAFRVIACT